MFLTRTPRMLLSVVVVALLGFAFTAVPAMADDPPPIDPTMSPSGGAGGPPPAPSPASPDAWTLIVLQILAQHPGATWDEIVWIALVQWNVLPPVYAPNPALPPL
jgi:hypothetical protein